MRTISTHRRDTLPRALATAIEGCFSALTEGCEMFVALSIPGQPQHLIYDANCGETLQDSDEVYYAFAALDSVIVHRVQNVGNHLSSRISEDAMVRIQLFEAAVKTMIESGCILSCRCTIVPLSPRQEIYASDNGVPFVVNLPTDLVGEEMGSFILGRFRDK